MGDPLEAGQWRAHLRRIYPLKADHIERWPRIVSSIRKKINHALVLGGAQGIGKDTFLEPLKLRHRPMELRRKSHPFSFSAASTAS